MSVSKKKLPDDDFLKSKNDTLSDFINDIESGKTKIVKKNSIQHKLEIIRDGLLELKDKDYTYRMITLIIKEHYELTINEQTVRKYCQDVLGFKKKRKTKNKVNNKDITSIKESEEQNPSNALKIKL